MAPALRILVACTCAAGALVWASVPAPAVPRAESRPNVIVLMTDDQDLASLKVMPRVRRLLAGEGTTFANSFVSFSLCCPSRATFLTGQYAHNHGVLDNDPPDGGYSKLDNANTLPVWLRRAGYTTAFVGGKYLNHYGRPPSRPTDVPPGWDDWHASVGTTETSYFDYTLNENGRLVSFGHEPGDYLTDVIASRAAAVVRSRSRSRSPYFLWVSFLAPHAGLPVESRDPGYPNMGTPVAAPRHAGKFDELPLPRPASFDEADVSDKPRWIRFRPRLDDRALAAVTANYRQRLESLLAVDEAVGRIVAAVRAGGKLENTVIVFTSDNGYFNGEHRIMSGKLLPYEQSIRVPLIVRGPGIPAGKTLRQPVTNVDVAPTILSLARATPGRVLDGRSLLPLLRDPGIEWGRDVLLESGPTFQDFDGIRTPRFLDARYTSGEDEFYDLVADPDELSSRHADPAYARMRSWFGSRIEKLRSCSGRSCRVEPALSLLLSGERGRACSAGSIRARVAGADTRWLESVQYGVAHRIRARASAAPWSVRLRAEDFPRDRAARVRARAVLQDGRRLTLDRRLERCP